MAKEPKDEPIVHCVIEATYLQGMQPEPLKVDAKKLLQKFIAQHLQKVKNQTSTSPKSTKPN